MDYTNIYLSHVKFKNFQSWKDQTIEFTNGLNIICAPNNTGKSVFFKALKIAVNPELFDKDDRKDYIRKLSTHAEIYYVFSDMSMYRIEVYTNCSRYFYCENLKSPEMKLVGEEPPSDLLNKLAVVTHDGLIGNLIDMDQDKFLVKSDDTTNRSILNMLVSHEGLDRIKEAIEFERLPEIKEFLRQVSLRQTDLINLQANFKYRDIKGLEYNINTADALVSILELLYPIYDDLDSITEFKDIPKDLRHCTESLEYLDKISQSLNAIEDVKIVEDKIKIYTILLDNLDVMSRDLSAINEVKDTSDYKYAIESIELLNAISQDLGNIKPIKDKDISTALELVQELSSISNLIATVEDNKGIDAQLEVMKEQAVIKGGTEFECPIHGRITYINKECIPHS